MNGTKRRHLTKFGHDAPEEFRRAIALYEKARDCFEPGGSAFGCALLNEATAHQRLAELGHDAPEELRRAITLYQEARACFCEDSTNGGTCVRNEAHTLRLLARIEPNAPSRREDRVNAHQLLGNGLAVIERMRMSFPNEAARMAFLDTLASQYTAMVQVCLDLADTEANAEQAEAWLWEAWHWTHRGKSRTLLDQIGGMRDRLGADDAPLLEQVDAHATEIDALEREVWWLRWALREAGEGRVVFTSPQPTGVEPEAYFRWLATQPTLRPRVSGSWPEVFAKLAESSGTFRESLGALMAKLRTASQPADENAADARAALRPVLDGLRKLAGTERRALTVEFLVINQREIAVFLVPAWEENAAPTVLRLWLAAETEEPVGKSALTVGDFRPERAVDVPLEGGALARLANTTLNATGKLTRATRSRRLPSTREAMTAGASPTTEPEARDAAEDIDAVLADLGLLFAPIFHQIEKAKWQPHELLLCPSGLLNLLPLHAATLPGGDAVIDRFPVSVLPTAALAPDIAKRQADHLTTGAGRRAVVHGDPTPDFPLAHAREEAQIVAGALQALGFDGVQPRIEAAATRAHFFAEAPAAAVIHLAAHSLLDEIFHRSGVELHERRLSVLDVALRVELERALLVYLSSCESGKAQPGRSDELMALVRVFLLAGCPTVMASLWALDDEAGMLFAKEFYAACAAGRTFAEANRDAMIALRDRRPGAFYWAPFILIGAGSTRLIPAN